MKKSTDEKKMNINNEKKTRVRKERKFFLYSDVNGFLRMSAESTSLPNFTEGDILWYETKSQAMFARKFFTQMKIADTLDILTKVA